MTKEHELGDQPIESKYHDRMNMLAATLDKFFNDDGIKRTGFVLMVFPFGSSAGRCNYISNASRTDVVRMLKEQVKHFEGR